MNIAKWNIKCKHCKTNLMEHIDGDVKTVHCTNSDCPRFLKTVSQDFIDGYKFGLC